MSVWLFVFLAATAGTVPIVAIISLIVAPLYGTTGWLLIRVGRLQSDTDTIESNEDDISSNEDDLYDVYRRIAELERDIEQIQENQQVIHDLITDQNHCGAEGCPWCDGDPH